MSDLDKKIQKSQPDLVQSVLEAQERGNVERVDVLITNALKQLKMSRFKPDQATCLSLIYLARISPKSYSQSSMLKELLKIHLRRDNGPANIKATIKNDFILPVLAANIMLACSDTPEIRSIILKKIEQWLSSNQKITENVQHLLAMLCVRCQGDPQTVQALIDTRQHWFPCFETIYGSTGSVATDLCIGIRKLLYDDNNCESLIENLSFLIKHDEDLHGLSKDVSKFILNRPITLQSMLDHTDLGREFLRLLLQVYNKLFGQLKTITKKHEEIDSLVCLRLPTVSKVLAMEQCVVEAVLTLLSSVDVNSDSARNPETGDLLSLWMIDVSSMTDPLFYIDSELTSAFHLATKIRFRLVQSSCDQLVDIGLHLATPAQLIELLQRFGTPNLTLGKIFSRLNNLASEDLSRFGIKDSIYLSQLLDFFEDNGVEGVSEFKDKLDETNTKETKMVTKIKVEA